MSCNVCVLRLRLKRLTANHHRDSHVTGEDRGKLLSHMSDWDNILLLLPLPVNSELQVTFHTFENTQRHFLTF